MANKEHVLKLAGDIDEWNQWRKSNPDIVPDLVDYQHPWNQDVINATRRAEDLAGGNVNGSYLDGYDLHNADLRSAELSGARLSGANLCGSNLQCAMLAEAHLHGADLSNADLSGADLRGADLRYANLRNANLTSIMGRATDLSKAQLDGTDFSEAIFWNTILANNDLSLANGLDSIVHRGPSSVGIETIYLSKAKIPELFLRGCGVPDVLITYIPSLVNADNIIQYYSCFISYSSKDEEFARYLHKRMREANLRVWFAPEDIQGGKKLHEQIDTAIRYFDKILIVLSEASIKSEWVITEIRKARKSELKIKTRKLFPVRLVDFDTLGEWECFDADSGKDLAIEVREYFIPNFASWKDLDSFDSAFSRLLNDLRTDSITDDKIQA